MFRRLIIFACLVIFRCHAEYKYDLSVCMIFRDEACYLKEWIEFHHLLGVQHFYLCNHNSIDNFKEVLDDYITKGIVELSERSDDDSDRSALFFNVIQQNAYFTEILQKARGESKWIAFLDSDEFLYPVHKESLIEFLKDYEEFGGIGVNWQVFGTSNISKLDPKKLMIEQLLQCAPITIDFNHHIKSIVKPECAMNFPNPHFANYKEGYFQVNTNKEPFTGPWSLYVLVDQLRINHYWTRDEDYFQQIKIPRRIHFGNHLDWVLARKDKCCLEIDLSIQRFTPMLRKKMNLD